MLAEGSSICFRTKSVFRIGIKFSHAGSPTFFIFLVIFIVLYPYVTRFFVGVLCITIVIFDQIDFGETSTGKTRCSSGWQFFLFSTKSVFGKGLTTPRVGSPSEKNVLLLSRSIPLRPSPQGRSDAITNVQMRSSFDMMTRKPSPPPSSGVTMGEGRYGVGVDVCG